MIEASFIRRATDEDGVTFEDVYEMRSDAGYNPDVADDLRLHVLRMVAEIRALERADDEEYEE